MSQDKHTGQNYNIKVGNESFERVEQFRYLVTLRNQNSVHVEIKSSLKSGNACYQSAQSFVLEFAVQRYKDQDVQNCNMPCCFIWV